MNDRRESPPDRARQEGNKTIFSNYIMPFTVFLVVAVFVTLILIMGVMDLRRLDRTLTEFLENRALDIVATIENVAQEDLNFLRRILRDEREYYGGTAQGHPSDKEHNIQERLIKALYDVARDIDTYWKKDELSESVLKEIAAREKLSLIVLLDENGHIALKSREFQQEPVDMQAIRGNEQQQLVMELLKTLGPLMNMGYITLHRKDDSGTIVIALDAGKLKYWGAKIAVKRVIGEIGWEQELAYLSVIDQSGNILEKVGVEPPPRQITKTDFQGADELPADQRVANNRRYTDEEGSHYLDIVAPVRLEDTVVGYARMGLKWDRAGSMLAENRNRMIFTTILIVLIGTLSTVVLYRNQSKQLARMEEMKKRLQRAEQLSALGQLAAGVAHEIRNPLNAISIATQRLKREYSPDDEARKDDFDRISGIIRDEIRRLNDIIEEFVTFFRIKRMELRPGPLEDLLERIVKIMESELASRDVVLKPAWNSERSSIITMDRDKLTQAFYNIIKNAMESIDDSRRGQVTIEVEDRADRQVAVIITDNGSGLAPEELERIFNPEYTTKEKGLGLGLTLAHEIIHGHRGEIRVTSTKGTGTTFEILLPLDDGRMEEAEVKSS
ncbi:MAG: hypothetical protein AVO39_06365 [delta proteobacterium MLS_D]|jgi:signal transduction histidine kinase|nr:MAG: hypothetical protein AVO39_06365 [delta proteobacterium MLS_D]